MTYSNPFQYGCLGARGRAPRKDYPALCHTLCAKCFCVARGAEALGACRTSGQVFIRRCTHPGCNSGARHPWLARHTHPEVLVDHLQGLHYFRVNHQNNSYCLIIGQFTVWERGRPARRMTYSNPFQYGCLGARAARPQRLSCVMSYPSCAKCFCVARGAEALGACRTSGQVFIRRCTRPGCNSGARHPWLARHTHPEALVDHLQGLHYFRVNHQNNSYCLIMGQFTVWERGRPAQAGGGGRKIILRYVIRHPC